MLTWTGKSARFGPQVEGRDRGAGRLTGIRSRRSGRALSRSGYFLRAIESGGRQSLERAGSLVKAVLAASAQDRLVG